MQSYSIVYRGEGFGYSVHIKDDSGARHTVGGFKTEAEAKAWVEEDRRTMLPAPEARP
jgi:hypothetical protein